MHKPDFSHYSAEQLRQVLLRIDRERFPERVQEIHARLAQLESEPPPGEEEPGMVDGATAVAGFWRRSAACLIDILVLALVGYGLGLFLHEQFAAMGSWGRAVGFLVSVAYFGSMESRLFQGQTLGKRALGIRVAGTDGAPLGVRKAVLRATVFCIPYFLNGIAMGDGDPSPLLLAIQTLAVFGLGGAIAYLYLFNRRTRQSIHDLLAGALVVRGPAMRLPQLAPVWRAHFAIMAAWCMVVIGALAYTHSQFDRSFLRPLLEVQRQVNGLPGIRTAGILEGTTFGSADERTRYVAIRAVSSGVGEQVGQDRLARDIARIVLATYPRAQQLDAISVTFVDGYDIGIASRWRSRTYSDRPDVWQKALEKN